MSKESKTRKTRSTKKVSGGGSPHTAELEAKIAELEAKLANLSSQVKPAEVKHTHTTPPPAPKETPKPRPTASGPTHGTLPSGFKASPPPPPPAPKEEPRATQYAGSSYSGDVSPIYAKLSPTGYTGNKYFATRPRLSYHPADKQFKGGATATNTTAQPPPSPPAPEPAPKPSSSRGGTLPARMAESEKKSVWKAKGAEYENYIPEESHKAPPPAPKPSSSRGTLPAGFNAPPPPAPKETPKPETPKPRPTASGPTHGTLPSGFKASPPPPPPAPKEEPRATQYAGSSYSGDVSPIYAKLSPTGYTGNKYFATRPRLSYHPADKQFTGKAPQTTAEPPAPEPAKPKTTRGTLPAGFKP